MSTPQPLLKVVETTLTPKNYLDVIYSLFNKCDSFSKDITLIQNYAEYVKDKERDLKEEIERLKGIKSSLKELKNELESWTNKFKEEFLHLKLNLDVVMFLIHQERSFSEFLFIYKDLLEKSFLDWSKSSVNFKSANQVPTLVNIEQLRFIFKQLKKRYTETEEMVTKLTNMSGRMRKADEIATINLIGLYKWAKRRGSLSAFKDLEGLAYPKLMKRDIKEKSNELIYAFSFIIAITVLVLIIVLYSIDPF